MLKAQVMCVRVEGSCVEGSYAELPGSSTSKVIANSNSSNSVRSLALFAAPEDSLVKLDSSNVS